MMERSEFKAAWTVDDEGRIEGLASVFGTADRGGDVVHKGAFKRAAFPVPMLDGHDQGEPIGVWTEGAETPEGLLVKGQLVLTVGRAREVRDLILSKAMGGLSIGYVATDKRARRGGGRDLLAVDLLEISVVAVPMHPDARITLAKSADKGGAMDPDELLKQVETKATAAVADAAAAAIKPLAERLDRLEAKANRPAGGGGEPAAEPTPERKAFSAYLRRGELAGETELKALSLSSDPNGGYLAPPELSAEILRDIVLMSPIRSLASVRGTAAPSVIYPTRKPMGNATWDDELDEETETSSTAIFGSLEVHTRGMSTFVDISNTLLQDAPQVEGEVRAALAEDFAKKESVAFVNGDGIRMPEGLMVHSGILGFANGHASVLQADALVRMQYALPPTYRAVGAYAMNGNTLAVVRTLKDTTGNYLWQPSYQAGQPETLLGRPVVEVVDMPDVAANNFPIIFGDFTGYRVLDRLSMSIMVDPYSQATRKVTRYHAGRRVGGRVIMAAKFRKLKIATTA